MERGRRNDKGQGLVLLPLVLLMLLAIAGLALDVGMAYVVKTKLSAAVDAAALAAAKVAAQGETAADAAADRFFATNYPNDLLKASVGPLETAFSYDDHERSWTVTVSTTASVPTYFATAVGWSNFTVGASATSIVAPVDLVLVLDCSESLLKPSGQTFKDLKQAAVNFVDSFNPDNDRIGLILFATGVVEGPKITGKRGFEKEKIKEALGDSLEAAGVTTAEEALRLAKEQLDAVPEAVRSRQRIIVFFADGAPNGIAANFTSAKSTVRGVVSSQARVFEQIYRVDRLNSEQHALADSLKDLPTEDWSGTVKLASFNGIRELDPEAEGGLKCHVNRGARNMAENIANTARSESITVFTVGLGERLSTLERADCGYDSREHGENIMRRIANVRGVDTYNPNQPTGIYAYAKDSSQLDAAFNKVARATLRLSK